MKGRYKFWLGFSIILLVGLGLIVDWSEVELFTEKNGISVFFTVLVVLLALCFIAIQFLGIAVLVLSDFYRGNTSIWEMDAKDLPDTSIGYLQIPVMLVKIVKHINIWADEKL